MRDLESSHVAKKSATFVSNNTLMMVNITNVAPQSSKRSCRICACVLGVLSSFGL